MAKKEQAKENKKSKFLDKKLKVIAAILIFVFAVGGSGLVFTLFEQANKQNDVAGLSSVKETAGLLIVTEGTASIERGGAKDSYEKGEYDVLTGDFVETSGGSRGYVIFSDNSSISLDENTKIEIQEQKHVDGNFVVKIGQLVGRTWSRVEKLFGGQTEYEVETPNTIAAVRGTEFDCDVVGETTTCYAIVHNISVDSKLDENGESELPEGEKFENNNGETKKEKGGMPDDEWKTFNECLSENISAILGGENAKNIDFLKLNKDGIGCGEILGEAAEVVVSPEVAKPVLKSVSDDGVFTTVNTLNCKWSATGAESYIYSWGTGIGKTNVVGWKSTKANSSSSPSLPLVYGQKYFCNVIAKNKGGNSSMKSSDGIYYDNSSGKFSVSTPLQGAYPFSVRVSGSGVYYVLPFSDLRLRYYVRSAVGKYSVDGAGNWSNSVFWHHADLSKSKSPTDFTFSDTQTFGGWDYEGATVHFELYNNLTGKVLGTQSVQLGYILK